MPKSRKDEASLLAHYIDKISRNRKAAAAGGAAVVAGGLSADQIVQAVNRLRYYSNRAAHLSGLDQDVRLEFGAPDFVLPVPMNAEEDEAHG